MVTRLLIWKKLALLGNLHLSVYTFCHHGGTEKKYKNSVPLCLRGEKYLKKCQLLLGINEGCPLLLLFIFIFTLSSGLLFCPKSPGNSEDTLIMTPLWIIGEKDFSIKEFNRCPGVKITEYTIVSQGRQGSSCFPCGLAKESEENKCLPSEIYLRFSLMQSYSRLSLALWLFGAGGFTISFDSGPPREVDLDTGFGWEEMVISRPFMAEGEHTITMKATRNFILFDYLEFTGYADTDKDGVVDQDEGIELMGKGKDGMEVFYREQFPFTV